MYSTQKNQLRNLSKAEFSALRELCRLSKNLYNDELPIYNANKPATYQFSGKRIKRGLYRSKEGHLINADAQGAANIGLKSKQNGFTGLSRGCLAQPLRIKIC